MGMIHLRHLHENLDLTFGEIKSILTTVAAGEMEVIEKFDGQSVFFTWDSKTGDIRAAYSEAEIKKGGLDPDSWLARWKDHPAEGAFVGGFRAIQRGVKSIDTETLTQIFGEDARNFVMSEIMFPANPNLINYDGSYIVMHNLRTYDESGKEIDAQLKGGQFGQLVDAVEAAEKEVDAEGWKMVGPQITKLKDLSSGKVGEMYASKLDSITGMSDDSTIADYVEEKLRAGVIGDLPIPVVKQEGIIKLILGKESAPSLRDLKAGLGKDVQKKVSALATKTNSRKTILSMTKPIERVISDFAIEILDGLASVFIENHSDEIDRLKSELEAAEQKIRSAQGSEDLIPVLTAQMEKLGDVSNITSSLEGIVFEHPPGSKQLYKLTGAFAMLNQIIGRAMRIKETDQNEALVREYLKYTLPIYVG
jgi:hypothetical protein